MSFKSFDEVFNPNLELPAPPGDEEGGPIIVSEGDMEIGLWCVRVVTAAQAVHEGRELDGPPPKLRLEGAEETAVQRRLLGEANVARITEHAGKATLEFYTSTVVIWHAFGREMAEHFWNAGGRPTDFLPAANRAARRARSTTSTTTGGAKKTPSRASMNGTKSPKAK